MSERQKPQRFPIGAPMKRSPGPWYPVRDRAYYADRVRTDAVAALCKALASVGR